MFLAERVVSQFGIGVSPEYARRPLLIEYEPYTGRLYRPPHGGEIVGGRSPLPFLEFIHGAQGDRRSLRQLAL